MKDEERNAYYAHYNPADNTYQSNYIHNSETADIAVHKTPIPFLENIVRLSCLFHDAGKYASSWQEYFLERIENPEDSYGAKEDHATVGGQLVREYLPGTLLSELMETAIYSHHGLQDCVGLEDGISLYQKRGNKAKDLPFEECKNRFYKENDKAEIEHYFTAAAEECDLLREKLRERMKSWEKSELYGNRDFFLGMYERLLLSLLIDADRRNTEDFMSGTSQSVPVSDEKIQEIWKKCCENVEEKIAGFGDKSSINQYRSEISDICKNMAEIDKHLYRLTVPTGAGKTLSSLRFAVNHAEKFHKKRIIYVAPFHSIVEQNAEAIKEALGMPEIVLEHHCNIVLENDEKQALYDRLTEDWSSTVVVTTAVQFLNTLFAGKMGNVRRMHSLCDTVIIADEVQALPVKVLELFNMAINFLTEFANATVVLCTATQPLLDLIPRNRLRMPSDMIDNPDRYRTNLKRTEIVDCTSEKPGGMNVDEAAEFVLEKAKQYGNVLFIVNTKACAKAVYQKLELLCDEKVIADMEDSVSKIPMTVSHLSTSMCPEHRSDTLKEIRAGLLEKDKIQICVSTQLIEAGVDISFRCVIRSMAGLDSLIQSAGRCNRHKENDIGKVFLIKMNGEAENVSRLTDIRIAQKAMQSVLVQFKRNPNKLDGSLDSEKAVKLYFREYLQNYIIEEGNPLNFPVKVNGVSTSIVELLSANSDFVEKGRQQHLKQAFKTAGEKFEVISDGGKISVIVPYKKTVEEKLEILENPYVSLGKKKQVLRELQPYTVSISQTERDRLGQGTYGAWNGKVLVLEERFYDRKLGITDEPRPMMDLQM